MFCGRKLPPRSGRSSTRPDYAPFSEGEREQDGALGVIGQGDAVFPDTLRQFRVRPRPPQADSVPAHSRVAQRPPAPSAPRRRVSPFWVALSAGVAAGVALASSFTAAPRRDASQLAVPSTPSLAAPAVTALVAPAAPASTAAVPSVVAASGTPSTAPPPPLASSTLSPGSRPATPPALQRRWLLERGRSHQRAYRLAEAERSYREVLSLSPTDSEALSGLGELALLRGTTDLADEHFQRALSANRDYIPAQLAVADIRWQAGRVEEAQRAYRDIVESYASDLYPPYVAQRSQGIAPPACDAPATPEAQP